MMNVLIAGSTGLVGQSLLSLLEDSPQVGKIYALVRRIPEWAHDKVEFIVTDFSRLQTVLQSLPKVEVVFSCLGTTKAQTPDKDVYQAIEVTYPLQLAQWAVAQGTQQFHYISALGTNALSRNHYQQLKGMAEDQLDQVNIPSLYLYRPGLLLGNRKEKRGGERIATVVMNIIQPLLRGKWARYRAIQADTVAKAMYLQATQAQKEHRIMHNEQIEALGQS